MSDHDFELRLQRVLQTDAERAIQPFDAVALAEVAMATAPPAHRDWRPVGWPIIRLLVIASVLLLAALATLWLAAGGLPTRPSLVETTPSASPAPGASGRPLAELAGPWIADRPATMSLGGGSVSPSMLLFVDSGGAAVFVARPDDDSQLLASFSSLEGANTLRLTSRAPTTSVDTAGTTLRGCTTGEAGTYGVARSDDGLRLTLTLLDDPCPARAAVYARTWVRSLGLPNSGGAGVIDAFDPLFTVELPAGSYAIDRSADHLTVEQDVPELQFLAWKNPQGWNDPCDLTKGRYPIEPGATAFVAYFRQLAGFTVDSTSELTVDGHHAVRLVVHANPDAPCSKPWEFQPKAETSTRTWFLPPGVTDSLVIVELADDTTLLFEVLPAPNGLEDRVIGSIRFLDALPSSP